MGVIHHHAVIANTWKDEVYESVREWVAANVEDNLKPLMRFVEAGENGRKTIVMCPDGSKEGWPASDSCDDLRRRFTDHLDTYEYDDGSSPIDYVEVEFGEFGQRIVDGNNENKHEQPVEFPRGQNA
jgi:hypothetical protein